MGKVAKGLAIAGAIMAIPIAGALLFPGALGAAFASSTLWGIASRLATSALLSGVSAQLQSKKRQRPNFTVEYAGTVEPRRLIAGKVRVSGMHVIPPLTSGNDNKYLHTVLAIAGHEVNAITAVYFNNEAVGTIGSITGTANDGLVSTGTFDDVAWVRRYLGTSSQTADYILNTAFTEWTSDHRGRGVAYIAAQFELDEEVYKNGRPEITCDVEGMKCYDPRLDSSPGNDPTNASYIAYTTNPALCLANYLCGTSLGLGDDPANIDWDMVADAADICDELVAIPTSATQARYTINGVFYTSEPPEQIIEAIAGQMLGNCLWSGGKWRIRAGAWETPSFEITDDDVMGPVEVQTAYPINERWNGIRGSFVDPDNNYQITEFPPTQNATYVSDDGESVFRDVQFNHCTNVYEAQRLAIYLTRKSRNRMHVTVPCSLKLWKVRPGMTGIVTITELGWSNKTVRCESWGFTPDGLVALTLREELASDWDDPLEGDYTEPLTISNPVPAYFTPDTASSLTATGTPRTITFTWTPPALVPSNAQAVIYEHTSSTPFSSAVEVWRGRGTTAAISKGDVTHRFYWVRYETPDGTAGPEYPSGAGVEGFAVPTTRTHFLTNAGPVNLTATGDIAVQSETITTEEVVEITATCRYALNAASGGTDAAQLYVAYGSSNAGADVRVFDTVAGIDLSEQSFTLTGLVKGATVGAGTYNFGLRAKLSQVPAGPPNLSIDIYDITVRVTVIAL